MNSKPKDPPPSPWLTLRIPCSPQQWADFKQRLLNLIQEIRVEKAVLARQVEASYPHFPAESVRRYLQESKDPKEGSYVDLMLSITCTLAGWQKREPLERFYQLVAPVGGFDRQTFRHWVGRGTSPLDGALPTLPDTVNAQEGLHKTLANSVMHESVTLNHQHLVALCGGTGAERRNQFAALVQHDGVHEHDIGAVLLRSVADKTFGWDALETDLIQQHNRITPFGKTLVLVLLDDVTTDDCVAVKKFVQTYDSRAYVVVGASRWLVADTLGVAGAYIAKLPEIPIPAPPPQTKTEPVREKKPPIQESPKAQPTQSSAPQSPPRPPIRQDAFASCSPDLRPHAKKVLQGLASLRAVGHYYLHSIQSIRALTLCDDTVNVQVEKWLHNQDFIVNLENSTIKFGATDKAVRWLKEQRGDVNQLAEAADTAFDAIPSQAQRIMDSAESAPPNWVQSSIFLMAFLLKQTPLRRLFKLQRGFFSWSSIEDYLTSKNLYVPIEMRSTVDDLRASSGKYLTSVLLAALGCIILGVILAAIVIWWWSYPWIFAVLLFGVMVCMAVFVCVIGPGRAYKFWTVLWKELKLPE